MGQIGARCSDALERKILEYQRQRGLSKSAAIVELIEKGLSPPMESQVIQDRMFRAVLNVLAITSYEVNLKGPEHAERAQQAYAELRDRYIPRGEKDEPAS